MIESLSSWAEQIILAVIIATIIEMLLPNGNNKKYIKAVIGVYIVFTIISPILSKITNLDSINIDYEKYFKDTETYQTMSDSLNNNNDASIETIYIENLKQDIKHKLNDKGYAVKSNKLELNFNNGDNYGRIETMELYLEEKKENDDNNSQSENKLTINSIEKVVIGNTVPNESIKEKYEQPLSASQIREIKSYLSGVYEVKEKNIKINDI